MRLLIFHLPIRIEAIGSTHELAEAMRFRGGLVSRIESQQVGGSVAIDQRDEIQITSLYESRAPQYARPS